MSYNPNPAPPAPPTPPPPPPPLPQYPELRSSTEIQGNILAGFRKDRQHLIFINFGGSQTNAGQWLTELLPLIATTAQVASFNDHFGAARATSGGDDPVALFATWINVSLTASGIKTLADPSSDPLNHPELQTFTAGAAASASKLGDTGTSDPSGWLFGRTDQAIDAVLTIQADRPVDFEVAIAQQQAALAKHTLSMVFEQRGETLPGDRAGHEHFGFKDGISQPGVVGFDQPSPDKPDEVAGHPSTDLINTGEFILGQQDEIGAFIDIGWLTNGSFHVIRRLAQDVPSWWAQVEANHSKLPQGCPLSAEALSAKAVGRWRSGNPLANSPTQDLRNDTVEDPDNNFGYANDPDGLTTPRFSHIRKVYPRDAAQPGEAVAEQHRIIRRGIPFGQPFDPANGNTDGVDAERGLVFAAFMSSIDNQFEFLQQAWANTVDFPAAGDGPDPVIGVDGPVTLKLDGQPNTSLSFDRLVTTEGTLYAFAPSISTLTDLAAGKALA